MGKICLLTNFEKIYKETYGSTLKYIVCHCRNIEDINDIIQDTYFSLYKALRKKVDIENMSAYVIGIAGKKINNFYKNDYKRRKLIVPITDIDENDELNLLNMFPSDYNLEEAVSNKVDCEKFLKVVNSKDRQIGKILYLYFYLDMTIKEISELLGMSESAVKNKIYRTLDKYRKVLDRR